MFHTHPNLWNICSWCLWNIVDAANSIVPSPALSKKIPRGFPEITQGKPVYMYTYDNSKQASVLGIKFRTKLEATKDILEVFSKRGL
jgi:hypothetical protein